VEFRYLAADKAYEILIPGYNEGRLQTLGYNGTVCSDGTVCNPSSTYNAVTDGNSPTNQEVTVTLFTPGSQAYLPPTLTYTSLGHWNGTLPDPADSKQRLGYSGTFVYGVPTAAGDVPISGSATYDARVEGVAFFGTGATLGVAESVSGTARLTFDFGAGTLAGYMDPSITDGVWNGLTVGTTALGRYNFAQTVFGVGATTFSGRFDVPGGPSSFEGRFNGPQAAELMARWNAPFADPRGTGTMSGVWYGAKQ
jgi:hypothetical protein